MTSLRLDVRIDGFAEPVGDLVRHDGAALTFQYRPGHLRDPSAMPVSLSLPLRDDPFGDVPTRAFFDNLLHERDGVGELIGREGIERDDVAGILFHLGADCPGALSVLPAGAPPAKVPGDLDADYEALTTDRLAAIVIALHRHRRLPEGIRDPSPLAGVQSKIAVTRLRDGTLALPRPGSGAPTTHILKVPDSGHPSDAVLEAAALLLSRAIAMPTAAAEVLGVSNVEVLLVTRFDRAFDDRGRVVRIHQEDFAQALGLPASLKYERRGRPGRRFDAAAVAALLDLTADPALERTRFIRATLFDLLIGNVDGHAKNHALLHRGRDEFTLAPRYDLLPTRLDPYLTDELAYRIGEARRLDDVDAVAFDAFLGDLGIPRPSARARLRIGNATDIAGALAASLPLLDAAATRLLADLIAANMRQLLPALEVRVPTAALERDALVPRGGGWLLGN